MKPIVAPIPYFLDGSPPLLIEQKSLNEFHLTDKDVSDQARMHKFNHIA